MGLTVWAMFATTINDGCLCFISAESFLKQVALPKGIFPARVVLRSLITFAHDVVILVIVLAIYSPPSILGVLASLMGIAIFAFNGLWIGLLFGLLSARFRDLAPIVSSVMQVAFFLTPVIWLASSVHGRMADSAAAQSLCRVPVDRARSSLRAGADAAELGDRCFGHRSWLDRRLPHVCPLPGPYHLLAVDAHRAPKRRYRFPDL